MVNKKRRIDLGLFCADVCKALGRVMDGKTLDDLSKSVCDAIEQLTKWVEVVIHISVWSLTAVWTVGPLQKFWRRPWHKTDATAFLGPFTRGMTRKRL